MRALVEATEPDRLLRQDVCYLGDGPPGYTVGRVVLVGDAAHAMLPTIGRGAPSALEDAVCVGRLIAGPIGNGADPVAAPGAFDRVRRPRWRFLARQAIRIARNGFELGPGPRQAVRNAVLRMVPAGLAMFAGTRVTGWIPPDAGTA